MLARTPLTSFDFKKKIFIWHKVNEKSKQFPEAIKAAAYWDFHFESKNIMIIAEKMPREDQETFFYDISRIEWEPFIRDAIIGTAIHLGKEDHIDPSHGFVQILQKQRLPQVPASRKTGLNQKDSS